MALTQVAGGMIASGQSIASPTFTGTSTFAGGVANAYGFGVGTAVPSSGAGIAFPATQSASSDANTLDDYEEGTWTPTLRGSSSNPTVSSSNATGWYTKIGNLVTLSFSCNFTFTGGSGAVWIGNIPFIPSALSIGTLEAGGLTMGGSYTYGGTLLGSGDDHVEIRKYSNAGSGETAVIFSNYASASWLRSNISFKT
jgi:hypothetical protein